MLHDFSFSASVKEVNDRFNIIVSEWKVCESFNISASERELFESFIVSQRQKSVRDESRLWSGQEEQVN